MADVSTAGTLVGAVNLGDLGVSSTTVNGVLFQGLGLDFGTPSATSGNFTITTTGDFLQLPNGGYGSASSPFGSLPAAYQIGG